MTKRYSERLELGSDIETANQDVLILPGSASVSHPGEALRDQTIGYNLVLPKHPRIGNNSIIIVPSQWSEYADRMPQRDRLTAMVAETGVPALAIDMPGQSPNSSRLTVRQEQAYADGDYQPLAADLWQVVDEALEDENGRSHLGDKEFILFGMSQGGTIAAAMAAAKPEKAVVSDIVLWNSPSVAVIEERDALSLALTMARYGGTDNKYYQSMNPSWAYREGPKDAFRIVRRLYSHAVLAPQAMAEANDSRTLEAAVRSGIIDRDVRINLVNASGDRISTTRMNHAAQYLLAGVSREVRLYSQIGENHAITNFIGAVAATAADIALSEN